MIAKEQMNKNLNPRKNKTVNFSEAYIFNELVCRFDSFSISPLNIDDACVPFIQKERGIEWRILLQAWWRNLLSGPAFSDI